LGRLGKKIPNIPNITHWIVSSSQAHTLVPLDDQLFQAFKAIFIHQSLLLQGWDAPMHRSPGCFIDISQCNMDFTHQQLF
jgi:hypothetical protein